MTYSLLLFVLLNPEGFPRLEPPALLDAGSVQPSSEAAPEGDPSTEPTTEPTTPEQHPIVPLLQGEVAPWSGLLLDEATFTEYLTLDLKVRELEGVVQIRTELAEQQRTIFEEAIHEAAQPDEESWWDRYGFTVGIVVGVVTGVGLMFGGMALLEYV